MFDDANNDKSYRASSKHKPNNLLKGTSALDKSMDVELKKYVKSMVTCAKYIDKKYGIIYPHKRKTKLEKIINNVHENFDIT